MHVENLPSPEFQALANAEIFNHGYLPIAAAYCRRLGLVELVNRMVETQKCGPGWWSRPWFWMFCQEGHRCTAWSTSWLPMAREHRLTAIRRR